MANEIFISYSRRNIDEVKKIKETIDSELGIDCWMDLNGIESGEQFKRVIIDAISRHQVLLFMLTSDSMKSEYALKEISFARFKQKRIVLVDVDHSPLTDEFYFDYGDVDRIDFSNSMQREKLLRDLRSWLGLGQKAVAQSTKPKKETTPGQASKPKQESKKESKIATDWATAKTICSRTLSNHSGPVRDVAFNSKGNLLATASEDGYANIYDAAEGKLLKRLKHSHRVTGVEFQSNDEQLRTYIGKKSRFLLVLKDEKDEGSVLWDWRKEIIIKRQFDKNRIHNDKYSDDGNVYLRWDLEEYWLVQIRVDNGETEKEFTYDIETETNNQFYAVSVSHSGKWIAVVEGDDNYKENEVKIYEAHTGKLLRKWKTEHTDFVWQICFSPNDRMLATASNDGTVKIWEFT